MEDMEFLDAKNGEKTCIIQGQYLHSSYNPSGEASRFVKSQNPPFVPKAVFVFEPGLSYCAPFFRELFPDAILCALRTSTSFSDTDKLWDHTFHLDSFSQNIEDSIFNALGEENIAFSHFCSWTPSVNIFKDSFERSANCYKNLLKKSHSILATRAFFEKRWITNSILLTKYSKNFIRPDHKTKKPVLAVCSGPSLKPLLPQIKCIRNKFFIICVSSAITPLLENNICPDLCISTDGGYWAKKHLEILKTRTDIPLAISTESAAPSFVLENSPLLVLGYSDGIETYIVNKKVSAINISRNGTVSGTALEIARELTDKNIYFTGLDLCPAKGFQHTQNNALEAGKINLDSKKRPKETRSLTSELSNQKESLKMYCQWFSQAEGPDSRVKRIIDYPKNSLGNILDISTKEFMTQAKTLDDIYESNIFKTHTPITNESLSKSFIQEIFENTENYKSMFPLDYLQFTQALTPEKKDFYRNKLSEKADNLKKKLLDYV